MNRPLFWDRHSRPHFSLGARACALVIGLLIFASLTLRVYLSTEQLGTVMAALAELTRFFTILTNFMVMVIMLRIALSNKPPSTAFTSAFVMALTGVGIVYHALLAHLWDPQGWVLVADHLVHTVAPILTLAWWFGFVDRSALRWRLALVWVAWPILYSAYALTRSYYSGAYPYPFLDAAALGYTQVALNVLGLSVGFSLIGYTMIAIAKLSARR